MWISNNILLSNQSNKKEIKQEIKNCLETNENTTFLNVWDLPKQLKKEGHSYTGLPQAAGKIPNKQSIYIAKETRKRTTKSKENKRKKIVKIRVEIKIELKNNKNAIKKRNIKNNEKEQLYSSQQSLMFAGWVLPLDMALLLSVAGVS